MKQAHIPEKDIYISLKLNKNERLCLLKRSTI